MNESELIRKLKLIEALRSQAATPGEKDLAAEAFTRFQERLQQEREGQEELATEHYFTFSSSYQNKLFVALLRRYHLRPYRYARQKYTTVMVKVAKRFSNEVLWPEFLEMSSALATYLDEATERVISQAVHADSSETDVVAEPKELAAPYP